MTGDDLVVDGRDIGTVVFPDCPHKFFITASPRVRAERRRLDYANKGIRDADILELDRESGQRDSQDQERPLGELKQGADDILFEASLHT